MIPVVKPHLPPKEEFYQLLDQVWDRNWLTNNGPLVNELELRLKEYLGLSHLLYVANGTLALQIAIKTLKIKGEIITTPFSYIATTSSVLWENQKPVFVDINNDTLNIDADKIEAAITSKTTAIMATHVFGNPCEIEKIDKLARKFNLKVIYDAAHCFGTKYKGESVLGFGDISAISFHATKLFHTIEGGAVITQNPNLLKNMAFKANFGHNGPEKYEGVGINAKNSEFHAAMGLTNLKYADDILQKRRELSLYYTERLGEVGLSRPKLNQNCEYNYAYYPVIFESEELLLKVLENLNGHRIFPRRYFHPSLNTIGLTQYANMPISESISKRVMCLPLYHQLKKEEIDLICRVLLRTLNYQ